VVSVAYRWFRLVCSDRGWPIAQVHHTDVTNSMSAVGKLDAPSAGEPPLLHTVEEAADVLRVGRTLAFALARRYEESEGLDGLPVIRLGNCLRVPRWALLSSR
jgi:hypothetical protein